MLVWICALLVLGQAAQSHPAEKDVERLQALEEVLEEAAGKPSVTKELGVEGDKKPRVAREEPKEQQKVGEVAGEAGPRTPRHPLDIPWSRDGAQEPGLPRSFLNSGNPTSYPSQPHVTFNLQAPSGYGYQSPQQGFLPSRPASGVNCGGQTVNIQDTHFATQHVPQTYTATVPFIAGYRLTPVLGQKQITLNDLANGGNLGGLGGGCLPAGQPGYWQNVYGHSRQADDGKEVEDPKGTKIKAAGPDQMMPTMKAAGPDQMMPTMKAGGPDQMMPTMKAGSPDQMMPIMKGAGPDQMMPIMKGAGPDQMMQNIKTVSPEEMWPNVHFSSPEHMWPQMRGSVPDQMWPQMRVPVHNQVWPMQMKASGPENMWPFQMKSVGPEEILRPFEQARFFQPPLELESAHGLSPPQEYQARIDEMGHHIEHLESLRENASDENKVE